jgi:hypothetical protein
MRTRVAQYGLKNSTTFFKPFFKNSRTTFDSNNATTKSKRPISTQLHDSNKSNDQMSLQQKDNIQLARNTVIDHDCESFTDEP